MSVFKLKVLERSSSSRYCTATCKHSAARDQPHLEISCHCCCVCASTNMYTCTCQGYKDLFLLTIQFLGKVASHVAGYAFFD